MDIASQLAPFLPAECPILSEAEGGKVIGQVSAYLELLLRWNRSINLTAVRDPEEVITRHFGESFFLAAALAPLLGSKLPIHAIDLGSGAGFPGIPLKLYCPQLSLTLIESHGKKAAFLSEVIRTLALTDINVFCGRAEEYSSPGAGLVTLRAVERFERALPLATSLLAPPLPAASSPTLALLIGVSQAAAAQRLLPDFIWSSPQTVPRSASRVLLLGQPPGAGVM